MSRIVKAILAITATIGLISTGTVSAQAAAGTLTYSQFLSSPGYQVLSAETTATANFLATQNGVRILNVSSGSMGGIELSHIELEMLSTATASSVTMTMSDTGQPVTEQIFSYADGYAYVPIENVVIWPELKNGSAALTRLKKTPATSVRMTSAQAGSDYAEYTPSSILGGSPLNTLTTLSDTADTEDLSSLAGLVFTEVTSAANATDPLATDYTFTATIPSSGVLPPTDIVFTSTFSQNHVLQLQRMSIALLGMTVENVTTLQVTDQFTMPTALTANTVDWTALVAMGKRISAEKALAGKAKAIAAKAAALAKSAKKTLTGTQITAAAKALKYAVTAIKNGVKLTTKYQGQSGSVCVTAVKGKTVTATC